MKATATEKILLPLDGSKRGLDTVRHLAAMKPFHRCKVLLFHVFNSVPECFWDLEREPKSVKTVVHVKAWESEQRKAMEAHLGKARRILVAAGFGLESVGVSVQNRKKGIARDIVKEAHEGYSAVMIRRRGSGAFRSLVLGSVATKLIDQVTFMPLLIVGRQRATGKILIAMDSSDGAMRAVDYVAAHLGGYDYGVHLLNVIRGNGGIARMHPHLATPEECRQIAIGTIRNVFTEARKRLIASGFGDRQISEEIVTGAFSRAGAVAKVAKEQAFDTIVVGRRGLSRPRPFAIGRVANKVIHVARRMSVWVIE
jgi:nucleotide-binding universal stress UspA family protein